MPVMYSTFHPSANANSPEPAFHTNIPAQPGVDEPNRFFDFDAWEPSSAGTNQTFAPRDAAFGFDEYVPQPYIHPAAPVHDARDSRRGYEIEDDSTSQMLMNFLSVDTAFSDLGLGENWQYPATFDASITLEDLNALGEDIIPKLSMTAENVDTPEGFITLEDCVGSDSIVATEKITSVKHKAMLSGSTHTGVFPFNSETPQPTDVISSDQLGPRISSPRAVIKSKRTRISKAARKILDDFFESNPYPGEAQTSSLMGKTQLTGRTIATWFSNTRARKKAIPSKLNNNILPVLPDSTAPSQKLSRDILEGLAGSSPTASLLSLQRYLETPTSEDSISMEAISTIAEITIDERDSRPMVTKLEEVAYKTSSTGARSVANSDGSSNSTKSWTSQTSFKSTDSRGSRRGRKVWKRAQQQALHDYSNGVSRAVLHETEVSSKPFFCTYLICGAAFRYRWEWARHEQAVHYQPYKWICCPDIRDSKRFSKCPFCGQHNVTVHHIVWQHLHSCIDKCQEDREFLREDQFLQHLNGVHAKARLTKKDCRELLSYWKAPNTSPLSHSFSCGFCGHVSKDWANREYHVHLHLKSGTCKSSWWLERLPRPVAAIKFGMLSHGDDDFATCHNCGFAIDAKIMGTSNSCTCSTWSCRYLHDHHHTIIEVEHWVSRKNSLTCGLCGFAASNDLDNDEATTMMNEHAATHDLRSCEQVEFLGWFEFVDHLELEHGATNNIFLDELNKFYVCQPMQECGSRARINV
jgi:hypothetical protein